MASADPNAVAPLYDNEGLHAVVKVPGSETLSPSMKRRLELDATQGIRITVQDVSFVVPHMREKDEKGKPRDLYLLNKVNGFLEPNKMTALMGPSGSGKTTLLDLLAGRKTIGRIDGHVLFAGQKPTREFLRRYTGYVEQFDTLLGILTVREMLMYTAELKRSIREPLASKKDAVDTLLKKLGLERCADVRIGGALDKGISGGQAKRTNIAIALITNPRILFLDEPTTGLDSYTANDVMTSVRALSRGGVTVCATIHSPTSYCFNLFDSLMMLVQGRVVYFGPQGDTAVGHFRRLVPNFDGHAGGWDMEGTNTAEVLVDIVTDADRDGKSSEFADAWERCELRAAMQKQLGSMVEEDQKNELPPELAKELAVTRSTVTPWWWGIKTLIKYRTTKNYTNLKFLLPRAMDKAALGLLIMTLYLGIGDDFSSANINNIAAILFMWAATPGFIAASYVPALILERPLFVRERNDGLYLVPTYLISKMFDELFINACASLGIAFYVFYGIGFVGSVWCFWMAYFTAVCAGINLAYFVASFAPNISVGNALVPVYATTLLFFCGFLIRFDEMPPWWKWYSYINFARYSWGAVMINQFRDHKEPWIKGQTVLEYYGLEEVKKWSYIGFEALFTVFFFTCTILTLTYKKYQLR